MDLPHSGIMRTKATKAYKANAATECLHSGMVEPKLRTPKASTCQVLSDLPSVEDDSSKKRAVSFILQLFFCTGLVAQIGGEAVIIYL